MCFPVAAVTPTSDIVFFFFLLTHSTQQNTGDTGSCCTDSFQCLSGPCVNNYCVSPRGFCMSLSWWESFTGQRSAFSSLAEVVQKIVYSSAPPSVVLHLTDV